MQKKISIFYIITSIVLFLLYIFGGYMNLMGKCASILCIVSSLNLVYRAYKVHNVMLFIVFTFMTLYTWPSKLFFFDFKFFSVYNQIPTYATAFMVTVVLAFFFAVLNFYVKFDRGICVINSSFYRKNNLVFLGLYFLTFVLILIFRPRGNLYAGDENASTSSMYEYVLILFLALYSYSNNEKLKTNGILILVILYVIFTFITGGRVAIIMLGFLLIAIKYQFKIKIKIAFLALIFFIWLMNVYSNIRSNPSIIFEGDIVSIINPFSSNNSSEIQASNEGDVYWASERLFILSEEGELTFGDRIESLFYYIISPISVSSMLPAVANLTQYKKDIYGTGGGSLAPIVFYMFGGFLGVFLLARFVGKVFNKLNCINGGLVSNYSILMYIMVPRWFAYYPIALIKFCVIGAIFLYVIGKIGRRKNIVCKSGKLNNSSLEIIK